MQPNLGDGKGNGEGTTRFNAFRRVVPPSPAFKPEDTMRTALALQWSLLHNFDYHPAERTLYDGCQFDNRCP